MFLQRLRVSRASASLITLTHGEPDVYQHPLADARLACSSSAPTNVEIDFALNAAHFNLAITPSIVRICPGMPMHIAASASLSHWSMPSPLGGGEQIISICGFTSRAGEALLDVKVEVRQQVDFVEQHQAGGGKHMRILQRFIFSFGDRQHRHFMTFAKIKLAGQTGLPTFR